MDVSGREKYRSSSVQEMLVRLRFRVCHVLPQNTVRTTCARVDFSSDRIM